MRKGNFQKRDSISCADEMWAILGHRLEAQSLCWGLGKS